MSFDKNIDTSMMYSIINVFYDAYCGHMENVPFGYVYRSKYKDGHSYIGKRKIYPHTDWMHYVGSGARLNRPLVVDKEFICFGYSAKELHTLEENYIKKEIDTAKIRDNVLNIKINVTDSCEYDNSKERYEDFINKFGLLILDVYLWTCSDLKTSEYLNCSRRFVKRFLHENNAFINRRKYTDYMTYDNIIYHYIDNMNTPMFGIICRKCNNIFETSHKKQKLCSKKCAANNKFILNEEDKNEIQELLNSGYSHNKISKIYNVSINTISSFIKRYNLIENENRPHVIDSKINSEKCALNNHIRFHIRKHILSDNCIYCINNQEIDNSLLFKNISKKCYNPNCNNIIIGRRAIYCSKECQMEMKKYKSKYAAHIRHHYNKHIYKNDCIFCYNGINNSDNFEEFGINNIIDLIE